MKIAFLVNSLPTVEQKSALKWARARLGCIFETKLEDLPKIDIQDFNIIWWHLDAEIPEFAFSEDFKRTFLDFFETGGGFLLTLNSVKFLNVLGIEPIAPDLTSVEIVRSEQRLGFASYFGHPVLRRLHNSVNLFSPSVDALVPVIAYSLKPRNLKVIAVERKELNINPERKIVFEFEGSGRILAVGSYFVFSGNKLHHYLDRFALNCLLYLNNPKKFPERRTYWHFSEDIRETKSPFYDVSPRAGQKKFRKKDFIPGFETNGPFYAAGERIVVGVSQGRINLLDFPPFKFDVNFKAEISTGEAKATFMASKILVHPECVELVAQNVKAFIIPHPQKEALLVHFLTDADAETEFCFDINIFPHISRFYDIDANGMIYFYETKTKAFFLSADDEIFTLAIGSGTAPKFFSASPLKNGVNLRLSYFISHGKDKPLNLVIACQTKESGKKANTILSAKEIFKRTISSPNKLYNLNFKRHKDFFRKFLDISNGDDKFSEKFRTAVSLLLRFFRDLKPFGKTLVSMLDRGIYKTEEILDSLPVFITLGYFEPVRATLEFLGRYQDVDGNIPTFFSECGDFDYDGGDVNFKFVSSCAEYVRSTKDKLFARYTWRRIKKFISRSLDFCDGEVLNDAMFLAKVNDDNAWAEILSNKISAEESSRQSLEKRVELISDYASLLDCASFLKSIISDFFVYKVDAFHKKIDVLISLRGEWEFLNIRNVRIKNMRINISAHRTSDGYEVEFEKIHLPAVRVILKPLFDVKSEFEYSIFHDGHRSEGVANSAIGIDFELRFWKKILIRF